MTTLPALKAPRAILAVIMSGLLLFLSMSLSSLPSASATHSCGNEDIPENGVRTGTLSTYERKAYHHVAAGPVSYTLSVDTGADFELWVGRPSSGCSWYGVCSSNVGGPGVTETCSSSQGTNFYVSIRDLSGQGGSYTLTFSGQPLRQCNDQIDNDGDGVVDYPSDGGCENALDDQERAACQDGIDNDQDGRVDYPADPGCASVNDYDERPTCETVAGIASACISVGQEVLSRELRLISIEPGANHAVQGYVDGYRFLVPGVGSVVVPCVVLIMDGITANPCADAGGSFNHRAATLVEDTYAEPNPIDGAAVTTVAICEAEVAVLALEFGVDSFPALAPC